jgi:lysophospholipase L1-like esterase
VAWQPLQQRRIGDVHTRYVNITDGVRAGWHPPRCTCRRLKVWVYGGSTTFGLGQRDGHTIASELARVAWEHGIALDVDNRGVVGDVHWQESDRYAWDVATYGPPDLVIFYDGINDTTAAQTLVNDRTGDRYSPVDFQNDDFWRRFLEQNPPTASKKPAGASVPKPKQVITEGDDAFAKLLMTRYDRSRKMSEDISKANGVPTYYVWQPTRLARPQIKGEPRDTPGTASGRTRDATVAKAVPDDVINLFHVFDPYRNPMFYDDQHHNEVGARIVASALYEDIAKDLRRLAEGRSVPVP